MDLQELDERLQELDERWRKLNTNADTILSNMDKIANESYRVADVASRSEEILSDLDKQFEQYTGLTPLDVKFLFLATALQVLRQYVLTQFPERMDDQTAAKNTAGHVEEHSNRIHRYYNPSLEEILSNPVPFDANIGADGALSGGGKMGHRVTAIGHDPILGLFFGTANIATSTLTNNHLQSFHISTNTNKRDYFKCNADTGLVLSRTKDKLLHEGLKGKEIVGASVLKELIHLKSDIGTKHSLPLPFVSVINAGAATDLAERGLDMANVVTVGKQVTYAVLINALIAMIHGAFYDESVEVNRKLYDVRTRKILSYSNLIASTSNLIYVGVNSCIGNEGALKSLDIGGLMVTLYRVATDSKFIRQVKKEFVFGSFDKMIQGDDLNLEKIVWE